jgi:hypothetical protein
MSDSWDYTSILGHSTSEEITRGLLSPYLRLRLRNCSPQNKSAGYKNISLGVPTTCHRLGDSTCTTGESAIMAEMEIESL